MTIPSVEQWKLQKKFKGRDHLEAYLWKYIVPHEINDKTGAKDLYHVLLDQHYQDRGLRTINLNFMRSLPVREVEDWPDVEPDSMPLLTTMRALGTTARALQTLLDVDYLPNLPELPEPHEYLKPRR